MAIVAYKSPWVNADGLSVYFPGDAGTVARGGEIDADGQHWTEVEIDLTTLATVASANDKIVHETLFVPKNAQIEEVHVVATKAATGATATLSVGLVQFDRTTQLASTSLVNALAVTAIDTVGEMNKLLVGSTGAGSAIGTVLANPYLITAKAGTADFTAGKVNVRVLWRVPLTADK